MDEKQYLTLNKKKFYTEIGVHCVIFFVHYYFDNKSLNLEPQKCILL